MDLSTLQPLLAAMSGVPVACVGDVMLDRYVYGEVSRISFVATPLLIRCSASPLLPPDAPLNSAPSKRRVNMRGVTTASRESFSAVSSSFSISNGEMVSTSPWLSKPLPTSSPGAGR